MTDSDTKNPDYGFYGTLPLNTPDVNVVVAWTIAVNTLTREVGCTPRDARVFLDSRDGRHFADTVSDKLFSGLTLTLAIEESVGQWLRWTVTPKTNTLGAYAKLARRPTPSLPVGGSYLTSVIKQLAIEDPS